MTGLTPQLLGVLAGTCGVGVMMALAGVQKHGLEWKRRRRLCPSCGRRFDTRACGRCAGY